MSPPAAAVAARKVESGDRNSDEHEANLSSIIFVDSTLKPLANQKLLLSEAQTL